jgi:hypothetical protein
LISLATPAVIPAISRATAKPGSSASGQINSLRPAIGDQSVCLAPLVPAGQVMTARPVSRRSASADFSPSTTMT